MRAWIVWATGLLAYIVAVLDRTTLGVSGLDAADRFSAGPSRAVDVRRAPGRRLRGRSGPGRLLLDRFGSRALIVAGAALMAAGQLCWRSRVAARGHRRPGRGRPRRCVHLHLRVATGAALVHTSPGSAGHPADRDLRPARPGALGHPLLRPARRAAGPPPTSRWPRSACSPSSWCWCWSTTRPRAGSSATETMSVRETLASVKTVWLRPGTRLGFFTHMGTQFSVTVFALMWGVPYLTVAQGLSHDRRGHAADRLGRRRHLLGHPDRHLHRAPSAPPVAAGARHHRQQRR